MKKLYIILAVAALLAVPQSCVTFISNTSPADSSEIKDLVYWQMNTVIAAPVSAVNQLLEDAGQRSSIRTPGNVTNVTVQLGMVPSQIHEHYLTVVSHTDSSWFVAPRADTLATVYDNISFVCLVEQLRGAGEKNVFRCSFDAEEDDQNGLTASLVPEPSDIPVVSVLKGCSFTIARFNSSNATVSGAVNCEYSYNGELFQYAIALFSVRDGGC